MLWVIVSVLLILLLLMIVWYSYRTAFYSPAKRKEDCYAIPNGEQYQKERPRMLSLIREMDEIPYESVTISAHDGTKLAARYYHVRDGAPLQIQFHGYRGTALRDFCGGNKLARESGQNTLVVDQRAHGKSDGTTITFGIQERWDCRSWVEYASKRFGADTPIILCGVSMGAATVLMASELELPGNVIGIIADCPYSSPEAIIRKVCREDMHLPAALTMPFVRLGARLFGHFDLREASAVEAVRHTDIPILLIHGEDDRFVPCDMSREIYDACSGYKLRRTFPGAGHGLSYIVDTDGYEQAVAQFTEYCLNDWRIRYNESTLTDALATGREIELQHDGLHYFIGRHSNSEWYLFCEETKEEQVFCTAGTLYEQAHFGERLLRTELANLSIDCIL